MADKEYGTSPENVRSASQILKDYEAEKKKSKSEESKSDNSVTGKIKNKVKSVFGSTAKSAVKGTGTVVKKGASSIASKVISEGAKELLGDGVKDFSFMNSRGSVGKTAAALAITAAGSSLIAGFTDSKEDTKETPEAAADKEPVETAPTASDIVPDSDNLETQEKIYNYHKSNGQKVRMMKFTDKQVEGMSQNDLMRLYGHNLFIGNPSLSTVVDFGKTLFSNQHGSLASLAPVPFFGKTRTLTSKFMDTGFTDDTLENAFKEAPSFEEQTPDTSAIYEQTEPAPEVEPAPTESREEITRKRAAALSGAFDLRKPPELESPEIDGFF